MSPRKSRRGRWPFSRVRASGQTFGAQPTQRAERAELLRKRAGSGQRGRRSEQRRNRAQSHYARLRVAGETRRLRRGLAVAALALGLSVGVLSGPWLEPHLAAWLAPESRVATIAVQGGVRLSAEQVAAATALAPGAPLAHVSAAALERELEAHPWVARASALRGLGGTVLVSIVEREARALLAPQPGEPGPWRAVDGTGVVFANVSPVQHAVLPQLHATSADVGPADITRGIRLAAQLEAVGLGAPLRVEVPIANVTNTARASEDGTTSRASDAKRGGGAHPPASVKPTSGSAVTWVVHSEHPHVTVQLSDDMLEIGVEQLERLLASGIPERESRAIHEPPNDSHGTLVIDLRFRDRAILRPGTPPRPPTAAGKQDFDRSSERSSRKETGARGGGPRIRHSVHLERAEDSAAHGG